MRVKLDKHVLGEFFRLIVKSKNFVTWKKTAKKVGCSKSTMEKLRKNKTTFSKKVFLKLLKRVPKNRQNHFLKNAQYLDNFWGIKQRWGKKLTKTKKELEKKILPRHLEFKARLCAYLAGDGAVLKRPAKKSKNSIFRYDIAFFPDNLKMAENFSSAFYALYGKRLRIIQDKKYNYLVLRCSSKIVYFDLIKICKFKSLEWNVPFDFLSTDSMKTEWLRAFFDCEAYVGKNRINLQSVNKKGIYGIKKLLKILGIETSRVYEYKRKQKTWNMNYILELRGKTELKNYLNLIGFNHSLKQQKLAQQCGDG